MVHYGIVFYSLLNIAGLISLIILKENVSEARMKRRRFLQTMAKDMQRANYVQNQFKKHTVMGQKSSSRLFWCQKSSSTTNSRTGNFRKVLSVRLLKPPPAKIALLKPDLELANSLFLKSTLLKHTALIASKETKRQMPQNKT